MQRLIGALRIYWKHAAILLAAGLAFQLVALLSGAQDKPKRPRITGIDHVRLYVTNRNKATEFYGKLFGPPTKTAYGCRTASHPCFPVWINQQIELEQAPSPAPRNSLAQIAYRTDDVVAMRRFLLAYNIGATPITNDANGARHFELHDPEGNSLSFIQRAELEPDFVTTNNRVGTTLLHAGFVVRDTAAENRFYLDLLGFKLYWYGGFKDDGVDWYEIQVPDGDNWIEYMLNIPKNANHKELGVQNHFSLGARDIHAAADQLHKNGVQKFDGPEIGRDGKWGLDAYDPDGTRVEVMEFTPAKTPCCHAYTAPHPKP
jgi:catechol 2,3-dioxygenase-like lactoylglutathione lyase family enzyme